MKNLLPLRQSLLFVVLLIPTFSFTQDDSYLRSQADELFKESRYYDAFFLYRELYGNVVSQNETAAKCSHAMFLTKQFQDYRAVGKIFEARIKLKDLLVLNPYDFHKTELLKMTLEEANHLQKMAFRQETAQESNNMLDKAISLYEETQSFGYKDDEIDMAIKQCKLSKNDSENYIKAFQSDLKPLQADGKPNIITPKVPIVIIIHDKQ